MSQNNRIEILGVNVDPINVELLHEEIDQIIQDQGREIILHVNVQCLNLAYDNKWLKDFLNEAYLVFCDGAGVRLGAQILGQELPQRITYADWMWQLGSFAEEKNITFFFLGGLPGVAENSAYTLKDRFPRLKIAGTHHGYFNKSPNNPDNKRVIQLINDTKPNVLIVGFGMPLQEKWLMENWQQIDANVMLTGGAVFDYLSKKLTRAPRLLTDNNLEWFGRLLIEPRRLWRRYLIGNPLFLGRIMKQRLNKSRYRTLDDRTALTRKDP